MPDTDSARRVEEIARRWQDLAERRLANYEDLYRSGRWRHYYPTQERFAARMLDVIRAAKVFHEITGASATEPAAHDNLRPAA